MSCTAGRAGRRGDAHAKAKGWARVVVEERRREAERVARGIDAWGWRRGGGTGAVPHAQGDRAVAVERHGRASRRPGRSRDIEAKVEGWRGRRLGDGASGLRRRCDGSSIGRRSNKKGKKGLGIIPQPKLIYYTVHRPQCVWERKNKVGYGRLEATALSVGKSVLNGALSYAKSTIAQEVALQLGVQHDQAFIKDELEMMLAFLMAAHEERDEHKVVKTWVKQVRDVSYDVEDCLQDLAVRLGKPSRWSLLRTLIDRHKVATRMKELRAKVEDVSQRNIRYRLIKGTIGPKPAISVGPSSTSDATMFGIEEARRQKDKAKVDLSQLINDGNENLIVIAVWGTGGFLGQTVVIKGEYDNLKRSKKFELYAWIRIVHPFNPLEFLHCIMRQFYGTSFEQVKKTQQKANIGAQVIKKMGAMKQDELLDAFTEHVSEKNYLIMLDDLSTIDEWDAIKEYFPNNKKGSRIIISTEHGEVASLCAGQESVVSELKQSSVDQSIFASYNKVLQSQTTLMKLGSSSSVVIHGANNIAMPTDQILENQLVGNNVKMVRKSLTRIGTISCALMESQLVGREKEKSDLINLISKQNDQQCKVISVWGMGGLGKTTLVKEVYQNQELSGLFEKRACVTIMHPFVLEEVLESLFMQLDAESSKRKGNVDFGAGTRNAKEELGYEHNTN
ncbi:uncharacterized protein LOC120695052 [Panicum virgatum]|uniref:uncharacterized protein LOC120695052 n=1 Tax=Panicum virgatum TaxID=38727 RepID=UPI0019D5DE3C|nr:uncharacterized protein LOC120695052 [Panicum virgatum]